MDGEYNVSYSKLENMPIINAQCCENLTPLKPVTVSVDTATSACDNKNVKHYKLALVAEIFVGILILCFTVSILYLTMTSGFFYGIKETDSETRLEMSEPFADKQPEGWNRQNIEKFFYNLNPEFPLIPSEIYGNRLKRDVEMSACQEIMELCKGVINSMWKIGNLVNNNMSHFQPLLKNFSTNTGPNSQFMELIKCLQCRNMITHANESNPGTDDRLNEHHDHNIKNNIDIVTNLLNNDELDSEKNLNSNTVKHPNAEEKYVQGDVKVSTVSVFGDSQSRDTNQATDESDTSTRITRTTEYESVSAEVKTISGTTSAPMIFEAEAQTKQMIGIDDMEQSAIAENVTVRPDSDNVTEIVNETVHPLVHPSSEGLAEQHESKGEADNGTKGVKKAIRPNDLEARIFLKDELRRKQNVEDSQVVIPTAETMKSTQQLQLTPTISWMPYPVCYYGPPTNGAPKQSAPGYTMYPASSPGAAYPFPMPQQRQGPQNSGSQAPSYVQVQAHSVQFLPQQPYPGNPGLPANQRVGPTGPGPQNLPIYPGFQPSPSGRGGPPPKSPYYCTYIPAPIYKFPAIPGVSEYERSAIPSEKNDTQTVNSKTFEPCSPNTIRCRNGQNCILRSQWCDGQVDCDDASDETSCSCRDRIAQERLCDGYFDCPHGEDELGCLGCSKTSFSCNDWNRRYNANNCVPLSQRCDGIQQCDNGKDEIDCNILTPTYFEGKNVFMVGYTEGYLHKNYMGQWYPVCAVNKSWAEDACVSEIGPNINEKPDIKIHSIPDNAYRGPYVAEVQGEIKLVPYCMNTAVYVRCPRFQCGTRVFSRQNSSRPLALENEGRDTFLKFDWLSRFLSENKINNTKDTDATKGDDILGSQLRIVGGRASQPEAWPFLVAIYKDGRFHCGGVILNEKWVLTAAHCLEGYMSHYYEIRAGLLRRFSFSPMAQSRKARHAIMYPYYDSTYMNNDIGMIMLDERLLFNRWVRPVCLPGQDILGSMWRLQPKPNSTCLTIGWGAMKERGPDPDHLREVEVPILKTCKYETDKDETSICAGYPQGGRDACQGDSGGPLMCRNPNSESQWYVAGIVSHGEGCAQPNEPGTYTRVSYFQNWIEETINEQIFPQKRTPLEKCPGFSCEGGLGKCLPIESRCNQMVDCLDGEDEINCYGRSGYSPYKAQNNPKFDYELVSPVTVKTSTVSENLPSNDAILFDEDSHTLSVEELNNVESNLTTDEDGHTLSVEELNNDESNLTTDSYTDKTTDSSSISLEPITTFSCTKLLQSISIDKRCNRVVDCEDGTDEINCTCKDYLQNVKATAICDGYVDCVDKTDEENCEICSENEFFCRNSRKCIDMSKKCDGQFDCEFKEDEIDCFTLTNGQFVYLDADERPFLNMQGVLTRYVTGKWEPTCHRPRMHQNQSTVTLIGKNMCDYFGFVNMESSDSISVNKTQLETTPWDQEEAMRQEDLSAAFAHDENKTCSGLYIRCRPVLSGSLSAHLTVDTDTGNRDYLWPWLAAIFVDGAYHCSAILLDSNWLLAAAKCVENVRLDSNYTTAVLGYGPLYRYVDGPHQQVSMIDEIQYVNNSVSVLLHLKTGVNITRHVRPLFLEKKIYPPGVNDTCVAIETDENYHTKSALLKPVLENCQSCHRCFVNSFSLECSRNSTSDWSGTVFCFGKKGLYPAATFQNKGSFCDFQNETNLTSIDHINPYLMEAIDSTRSPVEVKCDGFRCSIGQCIPMNRVCDGVPDCRDHMDEDPNYCEEIRENCENSIEGCNCMRSQMRCNNGQCVDKSAFCDRNIDCDDASDEPKTCSCAEYLKLTAPERLCDGVRHCLDKTDESSEFCPCEDSSFKCNTTSSNICIPQDFVCDGKKDCVDGEDEEMCRMLKQPSDGSAGVGEVFRRRYGIWHSECFSAPITTDEEASNLCQSMGYSSGSVNNNTLITEHPMIPKLNEFYIVKLNNLNWMALRDDKPLVSLVESDANCYRAVINCV